MASNERAAHLTQLVALARNSVHVGRHRTSIDVHTTFDPSDPNIKTDIVRMIHRYLEQEGYAASALTLQDEARVRLAGQRQMRQQARRIRKAVLDGDWDLTHKLATKQLLRRNYKSFQYACFVQEFLEMIDRQEYQKAFTFLTKRLKPLEAFGRQARPGEFHDLCFMLTCKSVQEVPSFKEWDLVSSREKLADYLQAMLEVETLPVGDGDDVPAHRLEQLLRQAVAYQIEFSRYHPRMPPKVTSLLSDYRCFVLPNALRATYTGHTDNVKCVCFVGEKGQWLASGSSDNTVRLWGVEEPERDADCDARTDAAAAEREAAGQRAAPTLTAHHVLVGHHSRIWDLASDKAGRMLASAAGDGLVRLWDLAPTSAPPAERAARHASASSLGAAGGAAAAAAAPLPPGAAGGAGGAGGEDCGDGDEFRSATCVASLADHFSDVYTVEWHAGGNHLATGGYDKTVRLYDVRTGQCVKAFLGHNASVSRAVFNGHGNLIVSGSKDGTIKFWDTISGACVRTLGQHLGEVTSVAISGCGTQLLSASKDNSNRLWDIRSSRPVQRLKGHQNTSKNFVRAEFGPGALALSGSEDGRVYVWDWRSGALLQRLRGHRGTVYHVRWSEAQMLAASCSHDGTVKTWWWDEAAPLDFE